MWNQIIVITIKLSLWRFVIICRIHNTVIWVENVKIDKKMHLRGPVITSTIGFTLRESTRYTIYSIMSLTLQRYLWLRNTKYTHNNNHQQVRNNSYLTDRDKTGHNYRENSEISDRLFNSVNPSLGLHERCGCCSLLSGSIAGRLNSSLNFTYTKIQ